MRSESDMLKTLGLVTGSIAFLIAVTITALLCTSCTVSFQNISTHGTATDLVDEDQAASPDVKTTLTIPVKAI